jgi:TPR repeat protein
MPLVARSCLAVVMVLSTHGVLGQPADGSSAKAVAATSMAELAALAGRGSAEAQYELGMRHHNGVGVPMDKAMAFRLFSDSAAQGYAKAEYQLARHHQGLSGAALDLQQAFAYTRKAAEHGHGPAQVDLGFLYLNGNDRVRKDLASSFLWFRKAAEGRHVVAQCMLGDFYRNGWGGARQDDAEAVKWYRLTAATNDKCAPKSQFELYVAYEAGKGVPRNPKTAVAWLKRSAEAGNPRAQYALGRAYASGHGVERDAELARQWHRRSREGVAPHDDDEHDPLDDHDRGRSR